MAKTINDKFYDHLNEQFRVKLPEVLKEKFGDKGFETTWSLMSMTLVTGWKKKISPKKTAEIKAFVAAYEKGFTDAMTMVFYFNRRKD